MFKSQMVGSVKWLAGTGSTAGGLLAVGQSPVRSEVENEQPFSSQSATRLVASMRAAGLDPDQWYFTYAVKYPTFENRTPTGTQIKECRQALLAEIDEMRPRVILALGATAFRAVTGGGCKMSDFLGVPVQHKQYPGTVVFPVWAPTYIIRNPQYGPQFIRHLELLASHMTGQPRPAPQISGYTMVETDEQMAQLARRISETRGPVTLDCETNGLMWGAVGARIRTVAFLVEDPDTAYVVRLANGPGDSFPCVSGDVFRDELSRALEKGRVALSGHNLRFDGEWLMAVGGVDIRPYAAYDTMLAEHMIDNTSMLGLEALALKYTDLGRYDAELAKWRKENNALAEQHGGFMAVPEHILMPYAAADVVASHLSMRAQLPGLQRYLEPIGPGLPGLFGLVMDAEVDMYEMEISGIPVDLARVDELVACYHAKRVELEAKFLSMVMARGFGEDFNHKSTEQVRNLLFGAPADGGTRGGLGLVPVSTTKPSGGQKRKWEWVMRQSPHVRKQYKPAADKMSLQILEGQHPLVYHLLNLRRVDTVCKNFFREDDEGGIRGNLWPDGRLHPSFSQCTDTGRLRSRKPNVQNFSKQSERFLLEVFGKDNIPHSMRSIVVAPDGWTLVEGDLKQAELFIMAGLSGDSNMMADLTTPGNDIHTSTTLQSFSVTRLAPDGSEFTIDMAIAMARNMGLEAFEAFEKKCTYLLADGAVIDHRTFKEGVRVAGKAISFGIPYGRGVAAIHQQVFAETGMDLPIQHISAAVTFWKTVKYPDAWNYLRQCQEKAVDPGHVENAWGRRRYFPKVDDEAVVAANMRESGNYPIQSTVADLMRITCRNMRELRRARNLRFILLDQIHDAALLMAPEEETEKTMAVLKEAMESVEVPLPDGQTMTLSADISVSRRWGEK